ncbi:MAG: hypothetical protein DIU78_004565 [Pseudomonadota bacterium]|nr:MAG: hypothetical protein DIU78_04875 [Pseudomonadota bacterium]
MVCLVAVGCGLPVEVAPGEGEPAEGEVGAISEALRCYDTNGNPVDDPNCPWRNGWSRLLPYNNQDISHRMAPALCASDTGGWLTVSIDTTNRYHVLQWLSVGSQPRSPSWAVYGQYRTWHSKPACAMREKIEIDDDVWVGGFVIAGKLRSNDADNNKIFASPGRMALVTSVGLTDNPVYEQAFQAVSNDVYTTGGHPAMSSYFDELDGPEGSGAVVLTFMGDDLRTIYAHTRKLPYTDPESVWSPRIKGPTLPSGWEVVGAPTITRLPMTFHIVVHARKGPLSLLFETHFFVHGGIIGHFSSGIGSPESKWKVVPILGTIDGEPWLTYESSNVGETVYFRRGTEIVHTSGFPLGVNPVAAVRPDTGIAFDSAPAATAGLAFDQGTHIVIGRTTSNRLYWIESNSSTWVGP